jgi:hypothetical protein
VRLDEIDRTLAGFRHAIDVMTANLFELENDTNRKLLDRAALTGVTAARWTEAGRALSQLWQWFTQFKDVVDRATALRGTRGRINPPELGQLDQLLGGPSVELSAEQIPLSRRGLLGPSETTVRCRPDELLSMMSQAFDLVKGVVAATGEAWRVLLPRLEQDEASLSAIEKLAASFGEVHVPELAGARAQLDDLSTRLANDPLSIDVGVLVPLEASLATTKRDLDELLALRADLAPRLDQARTLLAQLHRTMAEGRAAHDEVVVKIAAPAVPALVAPDPELARRLDRVTELGGRNQWRAARFELAEWTKRAGDMLAQAQRVLAANRAPIDERNELRGRLDAYRAKANRLGRAEDAELTAIYDEAHDALFTAPTDLATAARLVQRYQQAITSAASARPPEVPR